MNEEINLEEAQKRLDELLEEAEDLENIVENATLRELADYDWVYTSKDNHQFLHSADNLEPDPAMWAFGAGKLDCGLEVEHAEIPGFVSRMSTWRCVKCCEAKGFPTGKGSPKNDKECRELLGLDPPEST